MERNVGGLDRTARLVAGPLLVILGVGALLGTIPGGTTVGAVLLVAGAVLLGTGLTQRCLIHRVFGFDTFSRR
ncbi:MAG: YgaP family membrane protein [Halolamina sp.]